MLRREGKPSVDVLVVTYCVPKAYGEWIFSLDPLPGVQTNTFAHNLIAAMEKTPFSIEILSSPPVQDFPICPIKQLPYAELEFLKARGHVFATSNKPILKRMMRSFNILSASIRRKPKAVLIHGLYFPYIVLIPVLKILGIKVGVVLTDPSGVALSTDGKVRAALKKIDSYISVLLCNFADFGICLSDSLARKYLGKKACVITPGIISAGEWDGDRPSIASVEGRSLKIGYFGGLIPGYGVKEFAESLLRLPRDLAFEFHIFGTGPEEAVLRTLAQKDSHIVLHGFVPRDKALAEMRKCDALVNPRISGTYVERNSFPSKIFDYAMARRPIISSPLTGLPDELHALIIDIDVCDSRSVGGAVERLRELDDVSRASLGRDTFAVVSQFFGVEAVGRRITEVVSKVLQ